MELFLSHLGYIDLDESDLLRLLSAFLPEAADKTVTLDDTVDLVEYLGKLRVVGHLQEPSIQN